jgi:hypothetical protein
VHRSLIPFVLKASIVPLKPDDFDHLASDLFAICDKIFVVDL